MFFNESQNRPRSESNGICANQVIHTIVAGDTLYSLANRHNTTVGQILMLNPGTEIYNLRIGSTLVICPGTPVQPVPPIGTVPPPVLPPIGTLPPVAPQPPIGPSIEDLIRDLILLVLRWIRENRGGPEARAFMERLNKEMGM